MRCLQCWGRNLTEAPPLPPTLGKAPLSTPSSATASPNTRPSSPHVQCRWGNVTAASRRIARKSARWIKDDIVAARIINWTVCYGIALKQHLRGEHKATEFAGLMTPEQVEDLMESKHMPLRILDALTDAVCDRQPCSRRLCA